MFCKYNYFSFRFNHLIYYILYLNEHGIAKAQASHVRWWAQLGDTLIT